MFTLSDLKRFPYFKFHAKFHSKRLFWDITSKSNFNFQDIPLK